MNTKLQFFKKLLFRKPLYLASFLVMITGAIAAPVAGQSLKEVYLTTNLKEASITEVFLAIEKQTDFTFVFDNTISETNQHFNIQADHESLDSILDKISQQTGFKFKQINNTITVLNSESQQTIRGQVSDEGGIPLPGATVIEQGSSNGTTTDFDGNFTLALSGTSTILEISFIGFTTKTVQATPGSFQEITLQENVNALNEVVVTALGIKREEKKLGFSQATIQSDNLSQTMPTNWSSGLKGKVAGLNIVSAGSGPLNSQQITLRGNNSLNPNGNNALIVVDGVPVNNEMTTSGSSSAYTGEDSPIDYGNAISDLNLDDIESVTVLKGPGATALYGSRAANGALIITTKSGKKTAGLGITYNSSINLDVIQRWPDWQYEYGQGTGKSFDDNEVYSVKRE